MEIAHIDHFTLRVSPAELPALRVFYERVLGLRDGPRPAFSFPGHWLYAGERAIVHLAGAVSASEALPAIPSDGQQRPGASASATGKLDHISLRTSGLARTRAHLASEAIQWQEAPVPGMALHQVFFRDPSGLKIELTFDSTELEEADPGGQGASTR